MQYAVNLAVKIHLNLPRGPSSRPPHPDDDRVDLAVSGKDTVTYRI